MAEALRQTTANANAWMDISSKRIILGVFIVMILATVFYRRSRLMITMRPDSENRWQLFGESFNVTAGFIAILTCWLLGQNGDVGY
ncbi:MAG: hypothetical protein IPL99_22105 [Candidatus Competibacteraceae bacterium]|nr:hypothetical protein [Candidatus Competibacteraceae bacterium]